MLNPGSPGFGMPAAEDDAVRKQRDLERQARENAAARSLGASQIGNGGVLRVDGSLEVTGALLVPAGALSTAGDIAAGGTVSAGLNVTAGGAVSAGSTVTAVGAVSGASVTASGNVSGVDVVTSGLVYSPLGRSTNVTSGYAGAWLNGDGSLRISTSSVRFKQDVEPVDSRAVVAAILSMALVQFRRTEQVAELGDAAPVEIGAIAEYLSAAGLDDYVFRDGDGLVQGINWERVTIPLIATVQSLDARLRALEVS